jgi:hypothetical protein
MDEITTSGNDPKYGSFDNNVRMVVRTAGRAALPTTSVAGSRNPSVVNIDNIALIPPKTIAIFDL